MAKTATKTKPKAKAAPSEGFKGSAPAQSEWFATNHLAFKDGKLHQLHKGTDENGDTMWWWFAVRSID